MVFTYEHIVRSYITYYEALKTDSFRLLFLTKVKLWTTLITRFWKSLCLILSFLLILPIFVVKPHVKEIQKKSENDTLNIFFSWNKKGWHYRHSWCASYLKRNIVTFWFCCNRSFFIYSSFLGQSWQWQWLELRCINIIVSQMWIFLLINNT